MWFLGLSLRGRHAVLGLYGMVLGDAHATVSDNALVAQPLVALGAVRGGIRILLTTCADLLEENKTKNSLSHSLTIVTINQLMLTAAKSILAISVESYRYRAQH